MTYGQIGYTPGAGAQVAVDNIGGQLYQLVKSGYGGEDSWTPLTEKPSTESKQIDGNAKLDTLVSSLAALVASAATEATLAAINAKIPALVSGRQPVAEAPMQDIGTYNVAGVIAINTNLLVLDVSAYHAVIVQCVSMGTTGVVTPAFSGDGATTYNGGQLIPAAGGAAATTFNAAGLWVIPCAGPNLRLRLTTATTAGNTTLRVWGLAEAPPIAPTSVTVTATNLSCLINQIAGGTWATTTPATNRGAAVAAAAPASNADVTSAARTTSGNSGTIADDFAGSCSALLVVSAQSGTTPTLDVTLDESYDNGTTWQTIWAFPRFAGATGNARMPQIPIGGRRRWSWTIAGTTPSFTFAITTMRGTITNASLQRQYFDRTANILNGTASATTAAYDMAGCSNVVGRIAIGAATTPGTYQLEVSDDQANWSPGSSAVVAVANSTISIPSTVGVIGGYWRIKCTSGASGQTGTVASLYGTD